MKRTLWIVMVVAACKSGSTERKQPQAPADAAPQVVVVPDAKPVPDLATRQAALGKLIAQKTQLEEDLQVANAKMLVALEDMEKQHVSEAKQDEATVAMMAENNKINAQLEALDAEITAAKACVDDAASCVVVTPQAALDKLLAQEQQLDDELEQTNAKLLLSLEDAENAKGKARAAAEEAGIALKGAANKLDAQLEELEAQIAAAKACVDDAARCPP